MYIGFTGPTTTTANNNQATSIVNNAQGKLHHDFPRFLISGIPIIISNSEDIVQLVTRQE